MQYMGKYFNSFGLYLGDVVFNGAHVTVCRAFESIALGYKIVKPSGQVLLVFSKWYHSEGLSYVEIELAKKEIFK